MDSRAILLGINLISFIIAIYYIFIAKEPLGIFLLVIIGYAYFNSAYIRGILCMRQHQFPEAIDNFQKAIRIRPNLSITYLNLAYAFTYINQQETAMFYFSNFIHLNSNNFVGYYNRGMVLYNLELFDDTLADFNQSIKFYKNYPAAYYGRCNVYIKLNYLNDAIADFKLANKLEPKYPIQPNDIHGLYHAGLAHSSYSNFNLALVYLYKAARLCIKNRNDCMLVIIEDAIKTLESEM